MLTKYCKNCNTDKSVEDFYKNHRTLDGLFYQCKKCCILQDKKQTAAAPFKKQVREFNRRLKKAGHTKTITFDQFNLLLETQNNNCNICNTQLTQPCIDHNHSDGKIRSLLCRKCNLLLGMCNEEVLILEKAIKYLNCHS
jgi:hypothetical protein